MAKLKIIFDTAVLINRLPRQKDSRKEPWEVASKYFKSFFPQNFLKNRKEQADIWCLEFS